MSKVLPATCVAQVVTTLPVVPTWQPALPTPPRLPIPSALLPAAIVLGSGLGPSTGIAVIDEEQAFYVPNIAPDLAVLLQQVIAALNQVNSALQGIATGPVTLPGDTAGPTYPALATALTGNIAAIATIVTALGTLQGVLK